MEFDPKGMVCGVYQIIDYDHIKVKHIKDVPLDQCPGVFGFTPEDTPKVLNWVQDAIDYSKTKCK